MNAATMLGLTRLLFQRPAVLASLEGPNSFYLGQTPGGAQTGYNWGTTETTEFHLPLHHSILLQLIPRLQAEFGIGPERTILLGFSQPVGMNYRFAATHAGLVRGVIGICGGVPRDWEDGPYQHVEAALLHIARQEDEFYPPETAMRFEERLRWRARDVEFHMLPGRHRFPSKGGPIVENWLDRIFATTG